MTGFGAKLANGDQTYHGLCVVPYLAYRSIVAIAILVGSGILTATAKYRLNILTDGVDWFEEIYDLWYLIMRIIFILIVCMYIYMLFKNFSSSLFKEYLIIFGAGCIFGAGLLFSGMCRVSRVVNMLTLSSYWDPTLAIALGSAVAMNFFTFKIILRKSMPKYAFSFSSPQTSGIDKELILGSILIGAGWGVCGVDPGAAMINMFVYTHTIFYIICMGLGMIVYDKGIFEKCFKKYEILD